MGDREVEALRARPAGELRAAAGERRALANDGAATVTPHDGVLEAEPLEDADGLAVLARRDLDLVTRSRRRSTIGRRTSGCAAAVQSTQTRMA